VALMRLNISPAGLKQRLTRRCNGVGRKFEINLLKTYVCDGAVRR
jgi:hypothetical protein